MSNETKNEVIQLTPEILQEMIVECMAEQDIGLQTSLNEGQEQLVKLDRDTLKYFVFETLRGRRATMLLDHPSYSLLPTPTQTK